MPASPREMISAFPPVMVRIYPSSDSGVDAVDLQCQLAFAPAGLGKPGEQVAHYGPVDPRIEHHVLQSIIFQAFTRHWFGIDGLRNDSEWIRKDP